MYKYSNGPKKQSVKKNEKNEKDDDDEEDGDSGFTNGENKDNQQISRENNHVYFHAEVNRGTIFQVINHLRAAEEACILMNHRYSTTDIPIYLHINSFGGSVFDAMTAIDVIQNSKIPVHTIIEGATASAGTLMSVVGKKRYMRPNAYMLIHQLSSGCWGKMAEIEDEFKNLQSIMTRIKDIYKENAKIPKKELADVLKHDLWWDKDICIKYGLIDDIWTN
jgi:ATP-dependent Clp endopeptidase proteolytic subunit ClpP